MPDKPLVTFDGAVAGTFSSYDTTVRGYVRYMITRRNLTPYLSKKPMNVLDIGGGSGPDAAWLVSLGHKVTIIEISKAQRLYAERRFNFFLQPEQRALITMVEGSLSELTAQPASFDLVLCHSVAMYQENPRPFIKSVMGWARPGGIVSILEKGYYGSEAKAISSQNFKQLAQLRSSQKIANYLGLQAHAFTPDALETIIETVGGTIRQWGGVRVVSDDIDARISDLSKPDLDALLEAEFTQGNHPGIRAQGQMLHFIVGA